MFDLVGNPNCWFSHTQAHFSISRKMSDEDYYVRVMVDGVPVSDSDTCGGNPFSNNCKFRVSL